MKLSSKILLVIFLLLIAGAFSSNTILKKQYDKLDKSDIYWNYDKVLQQPFSHLKITGGNGTNIIFEQSKKPSVRLLHEWVYYHDGHIKSEIKNDTLYIDFNFTPANSFEKFWLEGTVPVRIFSPELLTVTGVNTRFEMDKLKQKSITINMSGKSKFEVESLYPAMDSINITQQDSTQVVFEMSPDYRKSSSENESNEKVELHNEEGVKTVYPTKQNDFTESMSINSVTASVKDYSLLDIGHFQVQKLQLKIADSAGIILSGNALKKVYRMPSAD